MKDTRKYWLWLSHICGQGSKTAVELVRHYGDARSVFEADPKEIGECGVGVDSRIVKNLQRRDLSDEEDILRWCDRNGVRVLVPEKSDYPNSLRSLKDAPQVLYCIGELPDFDSHLSCAVVGTRTMTEYGKHMAFKIGAGLADGGAVVVSGLALGVDGMAAAGAVEADGISVAVLGCGIDVVYPHQHEQLFRKVAEHGAVMTEFAPGSSPLAWHFPVRNRIISGLSQAVCVIEGDMASGSLITARHAIIQGRDLYAVPGNVGEAGAEGTNHLLKEGARPVTCAEDILRTYEFLYPHTITLDRLVPHMSADEAQEALSVGSKGKKGKSNKKTNKKRTVKKADTIFEDVKDGNNNTDEKVKSKKSVDFSTLSEDDRRVFGFMKPDVPMLADEIAACGVSLPGVMVSLTMLEMAGAVEAAAGGYYMRHGADFGGEPEYITEDDDGL